MNKERMFAQQRRWMMSQNMSAPPRERSSRGYEIRNQVDGNAEVFLYDEIGPWGVNASDFVNDLRSITARSITLRIASPGGDVADGLAILNALRSHPAMINTIVEGWAASAASFIAMAGDTIQMAPNSMLMIHDAMTVCVGNAEEMLETAALLDKHSDNIADVYQRRAGGTTAEWRQRMRDTTWFTAQEAVDAGLADGIAGETQKKPNQDPETDPETEIEPEEEETDPAASARSSRRVSAVATPVHRTGTTGEPWDGNAAETALKKPITVSRARDMYAWYDEGAVKDGELPREACKFPHHSVDEGGEPSAANLAACRNGLARLSQADIPEGEREGVRKHLQAHIEDSKGGDDAENRHVPHSLTAWDLGSIRASVHAAKEAS